jgi:hypothetical protein
MLATLMVLVGSISGMGTPHAATVAAGDEPRAVIAVLQGEGAQPAPQPAPPPQKDVTVKIEDNRTTTVWYMEPVWIAVIAIGVVVLLILVVLAARGSSSGGGPTVVKG